MPENVSSINKTLVFKLSILQFSNQWPHSMLRTRWNSEKLDVWSLWYVWLRGKLEGWKREVFPCLMWWKWGRLERGVGGNLSPGPTKNHFPRLGGKLGEERHSSMKFIIFPLLITISLSLSLSLSLLFKFCEGTYYYHYYYFLKVINLNYN